MADGCAAPGLRLAAAGGLDADGTGADEPADDDGRAREVDDGIGVEVGRGEGVGVGLGVGVGVGLGVGVEPELGCTVKARFCAIAKDPEPTQVVPDSCGLFRARPVHVIVPTLDATPTTRKTAVSPPLR